MRRSIARSGALLGAAAIVFGGFGVPSARAAAPRFPVASSATVGGARFLTERDDDAALTGVTIFVSAGLERQTQATNGASALVAECVVRTPVPIDRGAPVPLRDAIAARGGSLSYTVDESTVHYYLESRPERMPELLGLLGRALAAPDFSPATVDAARRSLTTRVTEAEKNPFRVGVEMFKESFLEAGTAFPDFGTGPSLAALGPPALRAFYARTYVRGGISASAIGAVTPAITSAFAQLSAAMTAGTVASLTERARPLPEKPTRIIAQRDVSRPFVVVGFDAPSPGQPDFGAMLVLETLLSNAFERTSATTLSLGERSVGALYLYDSAPASLVVYVNGGTGVDPTDALREVLVATESLAGKPLPADVLKRCKVSAVGALVTNTTSLADRSYLLGALASTGLGDGAINGALDAIEKTTGADVQRAAKRYLQRYVVAVVVPRQSE
jgi:predicted Zn-dependent peptidase